MDPVTGVMVDCFHLGPEWVTCVGKSSSKGTFLMESDGRTLWCGRTWTTSRIRGLATALPFAVLVGNEHLVSSSLLFLCRHMRTENDTELSERA